jgi:hypothetical protein
VLNQRDEVFVAEDRHGHMFVFSTYSKSLEWLMQEVESNFIDLADPETDYERTDEYVSVYSVSELVARFEKYEVDKVDR